MSYCLQFSLVPSGMILRRQMDVPAAKCSLFFCSQCKLHDEPGACPAALYSEQQQTSNLTEAVSLEFPDYVSDSQLNTITLT